MKRFVKAFVAIAVVCSLVSCSNKEETTESPSSTTSSPAASSPASSPASSATANNASAKAKVTKIDVTETEMAIKLSSNTAPAGPVEFSIKNSGKAPHEFVIFKTDLPANQLPKKNGELDENGKGLKNVGDTGEDHLKSGATKTLKVNLTPGRYVIVCNLPGHFKAGMQTAFTVK